ncbi:MAG: hypothetical protein PHE56_08180 [Bacteroidales bacterium]|nr:hypothetical protein [Bacteroidales bacterium]
MLRILKHITDNSFTNSGSVLIPAGVTKLTGVAVIGQTTCSRIRETSTFKGYNIRLMVNNKSDNPLFYDYQDSFLEPFNNVSENKRLIELNCDVKPSSKIDYIITHNSQPNKPIKLYLKFE